MCMDLSEQVVCHMRRRIHVVVCHIHMRRKDTCVCLELSEQVVCHVRRRMHVVLCHLHMRRRMHVCVCNLADRSCVM